MCQWICSSASSDRNGGAPVSSSYSTHAQRVQVAACVGACVRCGRSARAPDRPAVRPTPAACAAGAIRAPAVASARSINQARAVVAAPQHRLRPHAVVQPAAPVQLAPASAPAVRPAPAPPASGRRWRVRCAGPAVRRPGRPSSTADAACRPASAAAAWPRCDSSRASASSRCNVALSAATSAGALRRERFSNSGRATAGVAHAQQLETLVGNERAQALELGIHLSSPVAPVAVGARRRPVLARL